MMIPYDAQREVDDKAGSKQLIGRTNILSFSRKRLFLNPGQKSVRCAMSNIPSDAVLLSEWPQ